MERDSWGANLGTAQPSNSWTGWLEGKPVMDAKYNEIVDNAAVRLGMLVLGFGAWLAISFLLLYFAG